MPGQKGGGAIVGGERCCPISPDDIVDIQVAINNRPRKALGYLTPREVFIEGRVRVGKFRVELAGLICAKIKADS